MLHIGAVLPSSNPKYSFRAVSDLAGQSHIPDFTYFVDKF